MVDIQKELTNSSDSAVALEQNDSLSSWHDLIVVTYLSEQHTFVGMHQDDLYHAINVWLVASSIFKPFQHLNNRQLFCFSGNVSETAMWIHQQKELVDINSQIVESSE